MDIPSSDGQFPEFPPSEATAPEPPPAKPLYPDPPYAEPPYAEPSRVETHFAPTPTPPVYQRKKGLLIPALAGLEAGILGVIWMFVCFFIAAFWGGSGLWSIPNLFSTMFYGDYVYQDEFFHTTWAGLAVIVVLYSLLGVLWGLVWGERRRPFLAFSGALTGLLVYFLFFNFIWVNLAPSIALDAPTRQLQVAHILWGVVLAKSPAFAARISAATAPPASAPVDGPGQPPAEVVTGELIQ